MSQKNIVEVAEGFGISVDVTTIPGHEDAYRLYKGANQVFVGTENAVRTFLNGYEKERPGLYEGSMYAYKE